MEHKLKTLPEFYQQVVSGNKTFEARKNDRDFKIGDVLHLQEWDGSYTGQECHRLVTYMLTGEEFGIKEGYCILGIVPILFPLELVGSKEVGIKSGQAVKSFLYKYTKKELTIFTVIMIITGVIVSIINIVIDYKLLEN